MRQLPDPTVFTVRDAEACGWTMSALRNAVRHGRIVRVRQGVYTSVPRRSHRVDTVAAARNYPDCTVSHRSAALMHDLPLLGAQPTLVEVTVAPRSNANLPRIHVHRAQLRPPDAVLVDGVAVTSIARTLIDVARHRRLATAVAAIDAALQRGLTTYEELDDVVRSCWNWPGIARARRALHLADHRAESPLESVSRLVIPRLGLPAPEPQITFTDRHGRIVGRGDFYWDEFGVVGEADGRGKYDERPVLTAEKDRQEELEDLGLVAVRWGWRHVQGGQHILRTKLLNGFERGRRRDRSRFPRLWTL
ncbi:MAG: hypothetical protein QOF92_2725 [Pseudonocardiales bacterium]|nr:hypothetical protein [Pseudonocardiales bacterium]